LALLAFWGVVAFYPRKRERSDTGPSWLILAIWLGFLGAGLNAAYWRVFGEFAVYMEWLSLEQVHFWGATVGDTLWKGLGAASIYLHFYSRWKFLTKEDQLRWRPLAMGWYPDDTHWAARFLNRVSQWAKWSKT
jgi:hypothetical protein